MNNYENKEAELSLIGIILRKNDILAEADSILSPEDFFVKQHEIIFSEMLEMYKHRVGIDPVTLASHMSVDKLQSVGGLRYLMMATESPASLLNFRDHINEISRKSKNRRMAQTLNEAMELIQKADSDEVIKGIQESIICIQENDHAGISSIPEVALEIIQGEPETKIMTGFKALDRTMKGLRKGRVLTIAGRPGTGKTAFALRILDQLPSEERAIYFSMEMGKREITERLMAAQTLIKLDKVINKTFTEADKSKLIESKSMSNYNVLIDDSPGISIDRIKAKSRIEKIKHGLSVIFIDHIGLLNSTTRGLKAYERMTEISKGMKELAKELDITVIALSQLNRSPAERKNGEPLLSDLRDSGSIEQDSDQVILLYNPEYQDSTNKNVGQTSGAETLVAKIAKNRIGGIGQISFDYYKDTQYIEEQRRD